MLKVYESVKKIIITVIIIITADCQTLDILHINIKQRISVNLYYNIRSTRTN